MDETTESFVNNDLKMARFCINTFRLYAISLLNELHVVRIENENEKPNLSNAFYDQRLSRPKQISYLSMSAHQQN